jgi:acyl carrier protein
VEAKSMGMDATIRTFLTSNFYVPDPQRLSDTDSLLDAGIIDSTGVLELISFLEKEFGIKVEDEELVPENLDSVSRLVAFVERKRAAAV